MIAQVVGARATRGDIGVYFTGLGAVTPIYTVTLKSRVDGELMEVHFKEGDIVHRGDPLLEIDPRPYAAQLMQAEGQVIKDQALLANAQVDLARYQTLLTQNAVPEQQLATQKALVEQYEGAVKIDQGQINSAKLNVTYCHITAPIDGRIGLRLVDPGNIVHASDSNGLLVITQIQPISVIFTIAEDQLPVILEKRRAGAGLKVDAYDHTMTKKIAAGWLTTIDNQIDQSTGTVRLRATFDNGDTALFPNQFVNARLLVEEKHDVTLVTNAAIQRNAQTTYIYLVKPDSTVTVKPVAIGTIEGGVTEVTSGLSPGDVVVMTGVDKLQEGSKVAVQIVGESPQKRN
jgi:multidrug efflux system membrane fusion protein